MKKIMKVLIIFLMLVCMPNIMISADTSDKNKEQLKRDLAVPVETTKYYDVNGTDVAVVFSGYIYKNASTNTITSWDVTITSSYLDTIYGFFVTGNVLYANFKLKVGSNERIIVQYLP